MKKYIYVSLLGFWNGVSNTASLETNIDPEQHTLANDTEWQLSDNEEESQMPTPLADVLSLYKRGTRSKQVDGDTQASNPNSCVPRCAEYFQEVFSEGNTTPDDGLLDMILAQMHSEGFESSFLSWLAHQSLVQVGKDSLKINKQEKSRTTNKQRVVSMMMALPDEQTWQQWYATHKLDQPGKCFSSAQVMQAAARLVLASAVTKVRSESFTCVSCKQR